VVFETCASAAGQCDAAVQIAKATTILLRTVLFAKVRIGYWAFDYTTLLPRAWPTDSSSWFLYRTLSAVAAW
jgi:hypothetical protein